MRWLIVAVIVGLAACGGGSDPVVSEDTVSEAFDAWAGDHVDELTEVRDSTNEAMEALSTFNLGRASNLLSEVADIFGSMADSVPTDSAEGRLVKAVMQTCEGAYNASSEALSGADLDAFESAADDTDLCAEHLVSAAEAIETALHG